MKFFGIRAAVSTEKLISSTRNHSSLDLAKRSKPDNLVTPRCHNQIYSGSHMIIKGEERMEGRVVEELEQEKWVHETHDNTARI